MNEQREKANSIKSRILWALLFTSPVIFVFWYFGDFDRGLAVWTFMMMIGLALAAFWKFRTHVLFWIAAAGLLVAHVTLLVHLPRSTWTLTSGGFKLMALLDAAGNFAVMGLMALIQTAINKHGREPTSTVQSTKAPNI